MSKTCSINDPRPVSAQQQSSGLIAKFCFRRIGYSDEYLVRHTRASALLLSAAAIALATTFYSPTPASAQVGDSERPYFDSPVATPRAAKPRRVDAYQPADEGAGLGVLTSRREAEPAGGVTVAQAAPNEAYSPRFGEPVRPYESYDRVPLQPVPSPNSYPPSPGPRSDAYRPAPPPDGYPPEPRGYAAEPRGYRDGPVVANQGYGQPYQAPRDYARDRDGGYGEGPRIDDRDGRNDGTYSSRDILSTGHGFFGSMSQGLGNVVENAFKRQGRPNGYILGEEGGGAFVAGLRYGEGTLYTRDAGTHRVYWQGPSLGYDFGGAGSKVMMLVYNLRAPGEIYERFGGVDGSAYLVGGLGMTVLTRDHITIAPIRAGVGLRLGANVGYLKFTHKPTWNPF